LIPTSSRPGTQAIIEAARLLGCDTILTEDLAAGQDYDGIVVTNPFS